MFVLSYKVGNIWLYSSKETGKWVDPIKPDSLWTRSQLATSVGYVADLLQIPSLYYLF